MTNGSDRHHGPAAKQKPTKKAKPRDPQATLKRKALLPSGLAAAKPKKN